MLAFGLFVRSHQVVETRRVMIASFPEFGYSSLVCFGLPAASI
jgi:hypothetical protein